MMAVQVNNPIPQQSFREKAKERGFNEEQINAFLAKQEKRNEETSQEVRPNTAKSYEKFVSIAQEKGFSQSKIDKYWHDNFITTKAPEIEPEENTSIPTNEPTEPTDPTEGYGTFEDDRSKVVSSAERVIALTNNIHSRWKTDLDDIRGMWNPEKAREAERDSLELTLKIVEELNEHGIGADIDRKTGGITVLDEDGVEQEVNSGMIGSMVASKFEAGGAVGGAVAGGRLGGMVGGGVGALAGSLIGGGIGAFAGSGGDYLVNSLALKEDLDGKVALSKMADAGLADPIMGLFAAGAIKSGVSVFKGMAHVVKLLATGNKSGAVKTMLNDLNLTPENADEVVAKYEKLLKGKEGLTTKTLLSSRPMTADEKRIFVLPQTRVMGDEILSATEASTNQVIFATNERAQNLLRLSSKLASANPSERTQRLLHDYRKDIGRFFRETKNLASDIIDRTDYTFDLNKVAILPTMRKAGSTLIDPTENQKFQTLMEKVDDFTDKRHFSDLLELRQMVNKVNRGVSNTKAQEALKESLKVIDKEIKTATDTYLSPSQAKVWQRQYKKARQAYSKLKTIENNELYKALTKEGLSSDGFIKALTKYAPAMDETFNEVLDRIPASTRARAEGSILNLLTEQFTIGNVGTDMRATHFPFLAQQLKKIKFKGKASKEYISLVDDFAEVFQNDPHLGTNLAGIKVQGFQSYLTTDPVVRAKYMVSSAIFSNIRQFYPGDRANRVSLTKRLSELIKDPMKPVDMDSLISKFPTAEKEEIKSLVKNLQVQWVKAGNVTEKPDTPKAMYAVSTKGKMSRTNGGLGNGFYWRPLLKKPEKSENILRVDVPMSQLATIDDISTIMGRVVIPDEIRKLKSLKGKLKKEGFKGIIDNGRAMLFDSPE